MPVDTAAVARPPGSDRTGFPPPPRAPHRALVLTTVAVVAALVATVLTAGALLAGQPDTSATAEAPAPAAGLTFTAAPAFSAPLPAQPRLDPASAELPAMLAAPLTRPR